MRNPRGATRIICQRSSAQESRSSAQPGGLTLPWFACQVSNSDRARCLCVVPHLSSENTECGCSRSLQSGLRGPCAFKVAGMQEQVDNYSRNTTKDKIASDDTKLNNNLFFGIFFYEAKRGKISILLYFPLISLSRLFTLIPVHGNIL